MTTTLPRALLEQALGERDRFQAELAARRAALAQQAEPVEPVAWSHNLIDNIITHRPADIDRRPDRWTPLCKCADTPPQRKPLTIERLRDALVASRIIPPAAVEDPDGYDDGVTLFRIEALHRRIT